MQTFGGGFREDFFVPTAQWKPGNVEHISAVRFVTDQEDILWTLVYKMTGNEIQDIVFRLDARYMDIGKRSRKPNEARKAEEKRALALHALIIRAYSQDFRPFDMVDGAGSHAESIEQKAVQGVRPVFRFTQHSRQTQIMQFISQFLGHPV